VNNTERYPFLAGDPALGEASFRPYLPFALLNGDRSVSTSGLLDTGASINVLPYVSGIELGYQWEQQATSLDLTGNLAQYEARAVLAHIAIGGFEPVRLVFAWTKAENVPLILGQVNFFMEFDVCFYRSQLEFAINPKASSA